MAWEHSPPTDVTAGAPGHPDMHNAAGLAVAELQAAVDAIPAGATGPAGPKGDTGAAGPKGDPGEVTRAELDALAARVTALEA